MPSLWDKIKKLQSSVMLITGSEDSKYCRIATECLQKIPDWQKELISADDQNLVLLAKSFIDTNSITEKILSLINQDTPIQVKMGNIFVKVWIVILMNYELCLIPGKSG